VTSSNGAVYGSCGGDRALRIGKIGFDANGLPQLGTPKASWQSLTLPAGDPGAAIVADGTYKLLPKHSGKALDVAGCSAANHADVIQWPYWGGDCQEWFLDAVPGGFHRVTSKVGGKTLDVDGCSTQPGADVRTWPYWGGDCQLWRLVAVS
jgi:hypothetical protein